MLDIRTGGRGSGKVYNLTEEEILDAFRVMRKMGITDITIMPFKYEQLSKIVGNYLPFKPDCVYQTSLCNVNVRLGSNQY